MTISIPQFQLFFLAFTRIMAMIIHVPTLGGQTIPSRVRLGLGVALTLLMAPVALPGAPLPADVGAMSFIALGTAIFQEIVIGSLAGFAAVMTFGVLQMAGEFMSTGGGFGAGRVLNPALDMSGTAIDQLFLMATMLIFMLLDGHHIVLLAMQHTFVVMPLNTPLPAAWFVDPQNSALPIVRMLAELVGAGVSLALPIIAAGLLLDMVMGLLARVAPQVQVFFLGAPVKAGVILVAMTMALTLILPPANALLNNMGNRMLALVGG